MMPLTEERRALFTQAHRRFLLTRPRVTQRNDGWRETSYGNVYPLRICVTCGEMLGENDPGKNIPDGVECSKHKLARCGMERKNK